jgi:hypothetical protein
MSMEGSSLPVCFSGVLWIERGAERWFLLTAGVISIAMHVWKIRLLCLFFTDDPSPEGIHSRRE